MRTRRFENTLGEREAEAGGSRCHPVGFCSDALLLCLHVLVPASLSGGRPPPVGPGLLGQEKARGAVAARPRGPGGEGGRGQVCDPCVPAAAPLPRGPGCGAGQCGGGAPLGRLKCLKWLSWFARFRV